MSAVMPEAVDLADVLASTGEARRLRRDADLTITELAAVAGVSPVNAARWESGTVPDGEEGTAWAAVVDLLAEAERRDMRAERRRRREGVGTP